MSSGHFLLDEGPSPSTQPCQDRTACGSIKPIVSSQFHHPVKHINHNKNSLGDMIDDQLTFSYHIAKSARSCKFALFNIEKIRPFLSDHASQHLVQALVLFRLDYCNALMAGLPASSIKPLQLIQNAAAKSQKESITPLFINLHWLPMAARIKFKALPTKPPLALHPFYLNSLLQTYVPLEACIL